MENVSISEDMHNFMRLLLVTNTTVLNLMRDMFIHSWKLLNGEDWENSPENGKEFITDVGKNVYKSSRPITKQKLESGNISGWDLPLLMQCIKCMDKEIGDFIVNSQLAISYCQRDKNFNTLKEIRNGLAHTGKIEMSRDRFEEIWNSLSDVLLSFGVSQIEMDDAKTTPLLPDKWTAKRMYINDVNTEKAKELKEKGNELFRRENYLEAIQFFSEAIQLSRIPSEDLAVLYSNRSIAFLNIIDFESAKEDAQGAIHLQPTWWKGYYRLGNVYKCTKDYENAVNSFVLALGWKPSKHSEMAGIKEEIDYCILKWRQIMRNDSLDPMKHSQTDADFAYIRARNYGIARNLHFMAPSYDKCSETPLGWCRKGHKHKYGDGVQQDYSKAAYFYSKAAQVGDAEGIYNLAILKFEGLGIKRNIQEAIKLLHEAASQNITMYFLGQPMENIGVAAAEHTLGLRYEEGVGVPQDFKKAFYWYTRATKHGSPPSPNNIGIMYQVGNGVQQNIEMTFQYWKLSASRKHVRAMENLAIHYLYIRDRENARKWFLYSRKHDSVILKSKEKDFISLIGERKFQQQFDHDLFGRELLEEVHNGPLKHLKYENPAKKIIDMMETNHPFNMHQSTEKTTSRVRYGLRDPYRTMLIKIHRGCIKIERKIKGKLGPFTTTEANKPKILLDLIGLKPIHLTDMESSKDHIYEGFIIKLTLIEDALLGRPSIAQIGEDENGDAQRLFIYNFEQNKETQDSLGYGCRISIVNPYFRLTNDRLPAIRVDDTSLMFLQPTLTDKKRCRYCGKEKGCVPCRKCKRAFYCSKKCLIDDSSLLNHELVCFKNL